MLAVPDGNQLCTLENQIRKISEAIYCREWKKYMWNFSRTFLQSATSCHHDTSFRLEVLYWTEFRRLPQTPEHSVNTTNRSKNIEKADIYRVNDPRETTVSTAGLLSNSTFEKSTVQSASTDMTRMGTILPTLFEPPSSFPLRAAAVGPRPALLHRCMWPHRLYRGRLPKLK